MHKIISSRKFIVDLVKENQGTLEGVYSLKNSRFKVLYKQKVIWRLLSKKDVLEVIWWGKTI